MRISTLFLIVFFVCNAFSAIAQEVVIKAMTDVKREQLIEQANKLRKEENYAGAILQLDSILTSNPTDASILLYKGDLKLQSKLFKDAVETYKKLLPLNFETTITQINLSYALFMNQQPAKALVYAQKAWSQNNSNTNAIVNYFNAMLWNTKTKEAAQFLQQQDSLINLAQRLVLNARLHTTSGNYTKGLKFYDSLTKAFPEKYYVQEYAEVLLGKKEINESAKAMQNSKNLFSDNEYKAYEQKLQATKLQNAGTEMVYFKDVAKNVRIENSIWWQQNENRTYRIRLGAGVSTLSSAQNEKTKVQFANVHINEKWNRAWSGETDVNLQLIQAPNDKNFSGITGKQAIQFKPNDRRMFGASVSTDILNFTASLLGKNIRSYNLGYETYIMLNGKNGFYSQGSAGKLTDSNQRYQVFGSMYHLFRTEPTLKGGINFSALHFKNNVPENYFSPNRYLNTEVFVDYTARLKSLPKFYLQAQAAAGMQQIETQNWEGAYRMQAELTYRLPKFETTFKYQTGNVASTTGTGYSFNWFTFRAIWRF